MRNIFQLLLSIFDLSQVRFWVYRKEVVIDFIETINDLRSQNACVFERLCLQAELGQNFHHQDLSASPTLQEAEDLLLAHGFLVKIKNGKTRIPWRIKNFVLGLTVDFGDCRLMNTKLPIVQEAYSRIGLLA